VCQPLAPVVNEPSTRRPAALVTDTSASTPRRAVTLTPRSGRASMGMSATGRATPTWPLAARPASIPPELPPVLPMKWRFPVVIVTFAGG
jgi:hypothetical protein